jgi:hypothetical protein
MSNCFANSSFTGVPRVTQALPSNTPFYLPELQGSLQEALREDPR